MSRKLNFNEDIKLSPEEFELAAEAINVNSHEIGQLNDSNERLYSILVALENLESNKRTKGSVSLESIDLISSISTSGTDLPADFFFSSSMSLEDIAHKKEGVMRQFFQNLAVYFSKIVENFQYYNTMFNTQRSSLNSYKRRLSSISGTSTVSVKVGVSKYMLAGKDNSTVKDIGEYKKLYKEMADVMSHLNKSLENLADDDLFTTLKMMKSFATGNSDKYFKDRFMSLQHTMDGVKSSSHLKLEKRRPVSSIYASNIMLGLSQVVLSEPNKGTYDFKDQVSLVDAHKHFYVYVERVSKFKLSTLVSGSVYLDVTKKDIEELINVTDTFLNTINGLLSYSTKLSTYYAGIQTGSIFITNLRDDESDTVVMAYTRAGRMLNRISAILYDSVSSSYNFSSGNVKKAMSIIDMATKKLD